MPYKVKLKNYIFALAAVALLVAGGYAYFSRQADRPDKLVLDFILPETYNLPLKIKFAGREFLIAPLAPAAAAKAETLDSNPNVIKYADAYNNTDVVQTKYASKLKEDIILKQPGHPAEFVYRINVAGYDFVKNNWGDLDFYAQGRKGQALYKIFTILAPFMVDAKGEKSLVSDVETKLTAEGILTVRPSQSWLNQAVYPVTLDPTVVLNILNIFSHPQQGDDWTVDFITEGTADLKIIPGDQATIDDDEFVSLSCGGARREPQILAGDVIFYANWSCAETATVVHFTKKAGNHILRFEFGEATAYAHNSSLSIRQEINLVDAYLGALSGAYATSSAIAAVTDTSYNAPYYYFEAVASTTAATNATVSLVDATTGAAAATVTVNGGNTYARYRSASFLPSASSTVEYKARVNNENIGKGLIAARIIVLQNNAALISTETQIEIGNNETYASTATSTFAAPKYWNYDSTKWSGDMTFYAEVTYMRVSDVLGATTTNIFSAAGNSNIVASGTLTQVAAWGAGGAGYSASNNSGGGAGGGGGAFASSTLTLVPEQSYPMVIGAGGASEGANGATTTFNTNVVIAAPGWGGTGYNAPGGLGGAIASSTGTVVRAGGRGGDGVDGGSSKDWGGGGGGAAGPHGNGNIGETPAAAGGVAGGSGDAGFGGAGGSGSNDGTASNNGGGGGGGASDNSNAGNGAAFGGGGGGSGISANFGTGAAGAITLTFRPNVLATTTITLQESTDFVTWTDAAQIVKAVDFIVSTSTRVRSAAFIPKTGYNYRIAFKSGYTGATFAIYNAKIIVQQANSPSKLEAQYLLANTLVNSTGLANFDTYFDPAEWAGGTNEYLHQINASSATDDSARLETNPNGTPTNIITGSTVTAAAGYMATSSLTMPAAATTTDVNILNTPIYASRILVRMLLNPAIPDTPGHTNQTANAMKWTWDTGGSQSGYEYGDTAACAIGTSTANAYWEESSLSANTAYTRYVRAYNTPNAYSAPLTIGPYYTSNNVPSCSAVNDSESQITITQAGAANLSSGSSGVFFGCDGACDTGLESWITTNTDSATGLSANTSYTFEVNARNGNADETGSSTPCSTYTSANTPAAPTVSNATTNTLAVNPVTGGAEATMAIYVEAGAACDGAGGLGYVQAGGTIAAGDVWQADAAWGTAGTITVTGLSASTEYAFCVRAKNGDGDLTGWGPAESLSTSGQAPEANQKFKSQGQLKVQGQMIFR